MRVDVVKSKCVFQNKETLEAWLNTMAQEGYILQDFRYIFFMTYLSFHFVKQAPRSLKTCIYDVKYEDDKEVFYAQEWKLYAEHDGTCIFYSEQLDNPLPILNMKLFAWRRVIMTFCNLGFLTAVIFCIREQQAEQRMWAMFLSSFLLLALPRLTSINSTKKRNNWIRLAFNIILAGLVAVGVTMLFEQCLTAFAVFY